MKIQMKQTHQGSPDGIRVQEFLAGEAYEVPTELGAVFVAEGWAAEEPAARPQLAAAAREVKPAPGPTEQKPTRAASRPKK